MAGHLLGVLEPSVVFQVNGGAGVAARVQTPPNRRVDLENQDVELVNFDRSVWLDHSRSRSLIAARSQRPVFPGLLVAQGQDFS